MTPVWGFCVGVPCRSPCVGVLCGVVAVGGGVVTVGGFCDGLWCDLRHGFWCLCS